MQITPITRRLLTGTAALIAVAGSAQAQQVRFAGSTLGCFHAGLASTCTLASTATLLGSVTFNAGEFDVFSSLSGLSNVSYGAIGNASTTNSLGTVSSGGAFTASGNEYLRLRITFSTPSFTNDVNGVPGDNVFDVDYKVSGSNGPASFGGVNFIPVGPGLVGTGVVFDPATGIVRTGNFYTGGFVDGDLFPAGPAGGIANGFVNYHALDTRSVTAGGTTTLTSFFQLQTTTTPEPASVALLASGVVGLGGLALRRRRTVG